MCIGAASSVVLGGAIRGLTGGNIFDARAIATDAALGAVDVGIISKASSLIQGARAGTSLARVAEVRSVLNVSTSRNIAIAEGQINGQAVNLTAVSGSAVRSGTVALPASTKFTTIATGSNPRTLDSERKILEHVASQIDETATGSLNLFTKRAACISCQSVASQFSEAFPGVTLSLSSSAPTSVGLGASFLGGVAGQAASYFGGLVGSGGSGLQTLSGVSPR